jgi:hypothetical protein
VKCETDNLLQISLSIYNFCFRFYSHVKSNTTSEKHPVFMTLWNQRVDSIQPGNLKHVLLPHVDRWRKGRLTKSRAKRDLPVVN